jgi:hypothetical protein
MTTIQNLGRAGFQAGSTIVLEPVTVEIAQALRRVCWLG